MGLLGNSLSAFVFTPHTHLKLNVACRVSLSRVACLGVTVAQNSWLVGRGARRGRGGGLAPPAHLTLARPQRPHATHTGHTHAHAPGTARAPSCVDVDLSRLSTLASRSRCRSGQRVVGLRGVSGSRFFTIHRVRERGVSCHSHSRVHATCAVCPQWTPVLYKNALHATKGSVHAPYNRDYLIRIQTVNVSKDQSK